MATVHKLFNLMHFLGEKKPTW